MKIIISPAKKMVVNDDLLPVRQLPLFLQEASYLRDVMKGLSYGEAKKVWKCNEKIADLNYERFRNMVLDQRLTPAILAYEGIQYQYMAPAVLDEQALGYLDRHLRILSGFYGVLRPFDGVVPYRLEMQAKFPNKPHNLYDFWGGKLAEAVCKDTDIIVNLASKEYSKAVSRHLPFSVKWIDVIFGEKTDGKIREKGTYAKMARGEMVRYMAEGQLEEVDDMTTFNRLGYRYSPTDSADNKLVFLKDSPREFSGKAAE